MAKRFNFGCSATAIGSMPQTDPKEATSLVLKYLPVIPHWAQLPKRSPMESMCVQFTEGFPGVIREDDKVYVVHGQDFDEQLAQFYVDYEKNSLSNYATGIEYAAGLHELLSTRLSEAKMVKGQVTGPVTWGLTVTDRERRGVIYDDLLGDIVARFIRLKASWQEAALRQVCSDTIIFVDEPCLSSLGKAFVALPNERLVSLLEEVFSGISGLKGIHCCGGADWSLVLRTSIDILSLDAYNYAGSFSLYQNEVIAFLGRGGAIAWGIVPNDEDTLEKESVPSLRDRLEEAMAPFTRDGVRLRQLIEQGLITPSCGLVNLSPEASVQALELLARLSGELRRKYL